jgi:hypothetical protein
MECHASQRCALQRIGARQNLLRRYHARRNGTLPLRKATGAIVARWTGPAFVHASGRSTIDELVFGEPGDLVLLGSRSLGGLNFVVDPVNKRLVDAGAMPAAVAA